MAAVTPDLAMPPILAQTGDPLPVVFWSAILMGVVLVMFIIVSYLRRRFAASQGDDDAGFTLSDLRRMHKEGKITKEEFDRAKALVVERAQAALKRQGEEKE